MSLMGILDRVADLDTFDKVIEPARRAVLSALKPQALKDALHGTWLEEQKLASPDDLKRLEDEARAEIEGGLAFALEAPFPDPSEVTEDVFA